MNFIKYEHHGAQVTVRADLKGRHREHCLCFSGCTRFKPGQPNNCEIAQELYQLCVKHDLTTPVFECPNFSEGELTAPMKQYLDKNVQDPLSTQLHRFRLDFKLTDRQAQDLYALWLDTPWVV